MFGTIKVKVPSPEGLIPVQLRYPSDEEWIAYIGARRVIDRPIGGGRYETEVLGGVEANSKLLEAVLIDSQVSDESVGELLVDRLTRIEKITCECEGSNYRVRLRCMGRETEHVVAMPSAKQMRDVEGASRAVPGKGGRIEYKVNLSSIAAIYDQLATDKPSILHKRMALSAVIDAIKEEMSGESESF